jgi:phage repressor protein C with HTH and peptisase S24 domain
MSWATKYIKQLQAGKTVEFRPRGNSMAPKIKPGQLCTVVPGNLAAIRVGDIVLCRVRGNDYLHLVTAIGDRGFQISNNRGHVNGWTHTIFGKLVKVEN